METTAAKSRPLTEKEKKAIELMACPTGLSVEQIAAKVGVSRKTIWEYRKRPHFITALEESRREQTEQWKGMLAGLIPKAIKHLADAIHGRPSTHSVKSALAIIAAGGLGEKPEPTLASRVSGTVTIDFGLPKEMIEEPETPKNEPAAPDIPGPNKG